MIAPAVNGGTLRRILAYVNPDKLVAHNLSIMEVHAALRRQNVLIPAGSAKIGDSEFYIYTNAIPDKVAKLNDAPIKIGRGGQPVLFKDVGEVKDTKTDSVQYRTRQRSGLWSMCLSTVNPVPIRLKSSTAFTKNWKRSLRG